MSKTIYVSSGGSLQAAFNRAEENDIIQLSSGAYREKAILTTPGVTIVGQGVHLTSLTYGDFAKMRDTKGREYTTFRSFTLAICADNVTIKNMTIANDAKFPENKGQEVALTVLGDHFTMENCHLASTQDTLFAGPLPEDLIARYSPLFTSDLLRSGQMRQVYRNCRIDGSVDFIFGCGEALFEDCEIRSVWDVRDIGFVAAPAHALEQTEGFVFRNCRFTCEDRVAPGSIYLARPWRDYGLCRFENCTYGPHITAKGFNKWNDTDRDQTARFYETPAVEGRVNWINR